MGSSWRVAVVSVFETPVYGVDGWIKRSIDLALASMALVLLAPVMLTISVFDQDHFSWTIFFRQKRYGLAGNEILVWKFRSMKVCENGPWSRKRPRMIHALPHLDRSSVAHRLMKFRS